MKVAAVLCEFPYCSRFLCDRFEAGRQHLDGETGLFDIYFEITWTFADVNLTSNSKSQFSFAFEINPPGCEGRETASALPCFGARKRAVSRNAPSDPQAFGDLNFSQNTFARGKGARYVPASNMTPRAHWASHRSNVLSVTVFVCLLLAFIRCHVRFWWTTGHFLS